MRMRGQWAVAAGVVLILGVGFGNRPAAREPEGAAPTPAPEGATRPGDAPLSGGSFDLAPERVEVEPRVYVDPTGRVFRLWIERTGRPDDGGILRLTWSDDGGATWLEKPLVPPDRLHKNIEGRVVAPSLAFGPERTVFAVWRSKYRPPKTRLVNFQRSADGGATWAPESRTLSAGEGSFEPQLAAGPDGRVFATWHEERVGERRRQFEVFFARSLDAGRSWGDGARITPPGEDGVPTPINVHPRLALGPAGQVYLAWVGVHAAGGSTVFFRRSVDSGATWEAPVDVGGERGSSTEPPILLPDARGALALLWGATRDVPGPDAGIGIWVSRSETSGAEWTPPRRVDHAGFKRSARAGVASAARGPGGEIYVAWQDSRNVRDDIYLNRSVDGGATWLAQDIRLDRDEPGTAFSRKPEVAVSPDGTIAVAWSEDRQGFAGIYLAVSRDRGATWDETRVDTSPPPKTDARDARLAWAPGNILHLVWRAERHLSVTDIESTVQYRRFAIR